MINKIIPSVELFGSPQSKSSKSPQRFCANEEDNVVVKLWVP